jgi:hypothetical protein
MSNNAVNVRPVYRDSAGNPRANGWVYFYNNKTVDLAEIFSDELLSVAQANPYQLNAYGAIDGDVKYTGKLTVTHTNEDGSDPISDDDVESQGGATTDAYVDQFKVIENDPASMAVVVKAGRVMNGETLVDVAAQTTTLITAPTSNPRIDRVVVDRLAGVYTIVTGSESATPVAPAIPVGKMPSAQIALQTSTSTIADALITDERISGSVEPSNVNSTETLSNKTIGDTNTINAQDDAFTIDDAADATLQVDFNVAGTTGTKTTITSSQTVNRTLTLPDATDTLVGKATTDTLTNKTIGDTNTINAQDDAFTIDDAADATLQIDFNAAGTTGTKTTITSSQTANRTVTIPDVTDTLVARTTTDTLSNKTFTLPQINDTSSDHQYVFAVNELVADRTVTLPLLGGNDEFTFNDHTQVLSNKTLTLPQINDTSLDHQYVLTVSELAADRNVNLPLLTDNDEFTFNAHTQTLTNKTFDLTDNTLTGTTAEFNTALSGDDFATLTNSVSLTNKTIGDTNTINAQDDAFTIDDAADATLQIDFNAAGTTGTKTTITSSQTVNRVVTIPDATDTLVGKATTDTLTNKTIAYASNTLTGVASSGANTNITSLGGLTGTGTLSNYDEGTFTPFLADSSLSDSEGQTYTEQSGRYTRIGNRVHFDLLVFVSGLGTLTTGDPAYIGGLPFTSVSGLIDTSVYIGRASSLAITAGHTAAGYIPSNTSRIALTLWDSTTGTSAMTIAEYSNGGAVYISGTYTI